MVIWPVEAMIYGLKCNDCVIGIYISWRYIMITLTTSSYITTSHMFLNIGLSPINIARCLSV